MKHTNRREILGRLGTLPFLGVASSSMELALKTIAESKNRKRPWIT